MFNHTLIFIFQPQLAQKFLIAIMIVFENHSLINRTLMENVQPYCVLKISIKP